MLTQGFYLVKKMLFLLLIQSTFRRFLSVKFNIMEYYFINTEYIESVSGGDNEIIRELVTMFSAQVKEVSQEMRDLHGRGDFFSLGQLAHKAKSSVAIMGMTELAALLKTFEIQAKEKKDPEQYESYISKFEDDTKSAVLELENFVSNLK